MDAANVGGDLDAVLSVDVLKMFKPRPEVYALVTDHYKCKPSDVTFVSSNRWDVMAGTSVGFRGAVGQPQQDAGRISRFSAAADAERSQRAGDFGLSACRGWRASVQSPICAAVATALPSMQSDHFHRQSVEDLRVRVPGAQGHQSRHPARRDLRSARPQRRRQDHADRHHLRHPQSIPGFRHGRRPRHHQRLPRRALADRAGAAGIAHRRLRERLGDRQFQPRPVRQAAQSGAHREGAARAVAVGQEGQPRS